MKIYALTIALAVSIVHELQAATINCFLASKVQGEGYVYMKIPPTPHQIGDLKFDTKSKKVIYTRAGSPAVSDLRGKSRFATVLPGPDEEGYFGRLVFLKGKAELSVPVLPYARLQNGDGKEYVIADLYEGTEEDFEEGIFLCDKRLINHFSN